MKDYKVLIAFENHADGDIIRLNHRQAKYLMLSGLVERVVAEKTKKEEKK